MPTIYRGGATAEQRAAFEQALNYADNSVSARPVKDLLLTEVLILQITDGQTFYDNNAGVLYWNPTKAHKVITEDGSTGVTSPALALLHELKHWATIEIGQEDEVLAKAFERSIARELGEPVRVNGTGVDVLGSITVDNPTAHTKGGKWVAVDKTNSEFTGPAFDESNGTVVIGNKEENHGGPNGGGEPSAGGPSGNSSGGTPTGGGGTGNPKVDVIPDPKPPVIVQPEIIYEPVEDMTTIEIIGIPDYYF